MLTKTPLKAKTNLKKTRRIKKPGIKFNYLTDTIEALDGLGVAALKRVADQLFSIYVLYRDGEYRTDGWFSQCITCDKWVRLETKKDGTIDRRAIHWGHFQSSRHNITRYDEENVNAQCQSCNIHNQGEQFKYSQVLEYKYGDGTAKRLQKLAKQEHPFSKEELVQVIADCQNYILHCETHPDNYLNQIDKQAVNS